MWLRFTYLTFSLESYNPNFDTPTAFLVQFVNFEAKYITFNLQTPTSKQSKYKEQVAEMRKGRNSGLQKEQKEKHMVRRLGLLACAGLSAARCKPLVCLNWLHNALLRSSVSICIAGAQADVWQHKRASVGQHHQWLWPGALQESTGPCIRRSGERLFEIWPCVWAAFFSTFSSSWKLLLSVGSWDCWHVNCLPTAGEAAHSGSDNRGQQHD